MDGTQITLGVLAIIAAAFSGGFFTKRLDKRSNKDEKDEANRADLRRIQADENEELREWWKGELKELKESLRAATEAENSWRMKFWELLGRQQATEAELAALRPKFIEAVQNAQAYLVELETYRARARLEMKQGGE